jgi:hypothetical protein
MSFTTKFIIGDDDHGYITECPCCGEFIIVDGFDMREYEKEGKVYMECYNCERKFYLIKE